ncbi:FKBP12-associated protein [Sporothrix epigloea]|uniref:FKBP12-associated protein n=1 Tax=Sporothrix epigloea TaxID=1892477 RepID=A0ABP0DG27_9PEZI
MSAPSQPGLNPAAHSWDPTSGHSSTDLQAADSAPNRGRGRGRGRRIAQGGRGGRGGRDLRSGQPSDAVDAGRGNGSVDATVGTAEPTASQLAAPPAEVVVSGNDSTTDTERHNNRGRGGHRSRRDRNGAAASYRGRGGGRGGSSANGGAGSSIAPVRTFGHRLSAAPGPARTGKALSVTSEAFFAAADTSSPTGPPSTAHDLMTRIHEDIDSNNYDCPICLAPVTRACQIWSCTMCYHVTHFDCVESWLDQATTEQDSPLSVDRIRCPACNKPAALSATGQTAALTPSPDEEFLDDADAMEAWARFFFSYKSCWCEANKTPMSQIVGRRGNGRRGRGGRGRLTGRIQTSPSPMSLPPHSCGRVCGRPRGPDGCDHSCRNVCHAGPCPPCPEMGPLTACLCGGETRIRPCSAPDARKLWVCGKICNRKLDCGEHTCQELCHAGDCAPCAVPVLSRCYCGKQLQTLPCSARQQPRPSFGVFSGSESTFEGVFACDHVCQRTFDCGIHSCSSPCHAQDAAVPHCPDSPDCITHCPCGKTRLADAHDLPRRTACTDPVPTCGQTCVVVDQRCACESISEPLRCSDAEARAALRCENPCRAMLGCKQHRCKMVCCPGKPKAAALTVALRAEKPRGQRGPRGSRQQQQQLQSSDASYVVEEHQCTRPCGRLQKCGKHVCPLSCHSGPCPSCVAYELDDMQCSCGHTLVEAPFLCGTPVPLCDLDCPRPLLCGHSPVPHRCHDDTETSCPRCPRLVSKSCLCGKLVLGRVACGADNIQCSNACGAILACGVHTCRKACHRPGECEDTTTVAGRENGQESTLVACGQTCNRPKPVCGHPCTDRCHGIDAICRTVDPCGAAVEVHCPCGRLVRKVRCNACDSDPAPAHRHPVCDDECLRIQRNLLLRDALRISDDYKDEHLPYAHGLMEVYLNNRAFVTAHEKTLRTAFGGVLADVSSPTPAPVVAFKPMKRRERQILHMLAETFGLRSESRDSEPHRHVVVGRLARSDLSFPQLTIPESEEIYCRLRDKAKAEADASAAAALAARQAREASEEAAAQRRAARKWLFNAVFVPAAVKDAIVAHSGGVADPEQLLPADVFQLIVEAWHEQQSSCSVSSATLQQCTLPFGDVALRLLVPATAPAIVQQLAAFLLTYAEALWDVEAVPSSANARLALCHVDAQHNILRMGGQTLEEQADESGQDGDSDEDAPDRWNVVAAVATRPSLSRPAPADVAVSESAAPLQKSPPKAQARTMFTLKKKSTGPVSFTIRKRKEWMDILASQPTDDEADENGEAEAGSESVESNEREHGDEDKVRSTSEEILLEE